MRYGNYRFHCQFENAAQLPPYKGSTFRGVFGHALKSVVCALKRQTCGGCLLKEQCVYTLVFETGLAKPPPEGARIAETPHPFVIEPPETEQTDFSTGDAFDFNLLLFGDVNHHLPYFIYAFDAMGSIGIGRRINGHRGRFSLKSVWLNENPIYWNEDQKLVMNETLPTLALKPASSPVTEKTERISIELTTPLRLKFQNQLTHILPFHILTRAMLRRADALLQCWGDGEPDIDFKGLVKKAKTVQTIADDLRWYDWQRYSQRQDQKMLMGGLIGSATYKGDLTEFIPLIEFCEKTHLGKQTAFGLGQIKLERVE